MRLLRAVRDHAAPALLLVATAALAVATLVVSAAAGGEARREVLLTPAALALLVAAGPATDLARRRRAELTLVRLRGAHGLPLLVRVVGEPVWLVVGAGVVGMIAGGVVARLLHSRWGTPELIEPADLVPALVLIGALAVVAAAAAGLVARESLQLALRRPQWSGAGPGADFVARAAAIATLLAAFLAVYSAAGDDSGTLVLVGPVLLGIAAGQLTVWVVRSLSPVLGRRLGARSIAVLLGVRRALGVTHVTRLRAVVASAVVATSCLSAVLATSAWADDSARLTQGAPLRLELPNGTAHGALLLSRRLDPEGRWLMAVAVNVAREEARYRTVWLDLERYARVSSAFLASTHADLDRALDELRAAPTVRLVTGDVIELSSTGPGPGTGSATVNYVGDAGDVGTVEVLLAGGRAEVEDCVEGCVVLSLVATEAVELTGLSLGRTDLLDQVWVDEEGATVGPGALSLAPRVIVRPSEGSAPVPVLVAGRPGYGERPEVSDVGGALRPVEQVGDRPALPFVEGAGLLGDLTVALAGAPGTIPAVHSVVLARSDTPDDVLAGLRAAGAGPPVALAGADGALGDRERAEDRVRRAGLVAATGLFQIALLTGRRRRCEDGAHDDAALRLIGVPLAVLRRARLVETGAVAGLVLVATLLAGWLVTVIVTEAGLVPVGPARPPLDSSPRIVVVVGVAAAAALATGATTLLEARRRRLAPLVAGEET